MMVSRGKNDITECYLFVQPANLAGNTMAATVTILNFEFEFLRLCVDDECDKITVCDAMPAVRQVG